MGACPIESLASHMVDVTYTALQSLRRSATVQAGLHSLELSAAVRNIYSVHCTLCILCLQQHKAIDTAQQLTLESIIFRRAMRLLSTMKGRLSKKSAILQLINSSADE
jgi:hypothetical protein